MGRIPAVLCAVSALALAHCEASDGGGSSGSGSSSILGMYEAIDHAINTESCSAGATTTISEFTRVPGVGQIAHKPYFRLIQDKWGVDFEWCESLDTDSCSWSMIGFESATGKPKENAQAGNYNFGVYDCSNGRSLYEAALTEEGHVRVEVRQWEQNFDGVMLSESGECSLPAAQSLKGDEHCELYELIVGSPLD